MGLEIDKYYSPMDIFILLCEILNKQFAFYKIKLLLSGVPLAIPIFICRFF